MRRFLVLLAVAITSLGAEETFTGVRRVVAVGDVHGDYGQFLAILQDAGVVNKRGRWIGGKAHLVQTGDVPDRGPDTRKVLDLLMSLEKQASRAGGMVHALIGNHEAMNLYGDLRYVTPEEFAAFRNSNSAAVRDEFWARHVAENPAAENDRDYKTKWYDDHPLGWFEHRFEYGSRGRYGKWIRSHNAAIRIDDSLFLHAGIALPLAGYSLREINDRVRAELNDFSLLENGIVTAQDGPLWYRGLAQGDQQELAPHVDAVLRHFGVKRIVIGHTPTDGTVVARFGGKVIQIDVGMSKVYGSHRACLLIEDGQVFAVQEGTKIPLEGTASVAAGRLVYLPSAF